VVLCLTEEIVHTYYILEPKSTQLKYLTELENGNELQITKFSILINGNINLIPIGQVTELPTEQAACTQQVYTTQSALTD
jgi:hypothetical protein